mgnify:CR=1 FL=1
MLFRSLVVGCPAHNSSVSGRVLSYRWVASFPSPHWILIDDIVDPQPELHGMFGQSIAIDTKHSIAVGAPASSVDYHGHVYIFDGPHVVSVIEHSRGDWSFGSSITLHDDVLVTGAPGQDSKSYEDSGILFMFSVRELSAVTLAITFVTTSLSEIFRWFLFHNYFKNNNNLQAFWHTRGCCFNCSRDPFLLQVAPIQCHRSQSCCKGVMTIDDDEQIQIFFLLFFSRMCSFLYSSLYVFTLRVYWRGEFNNGVFVCLNLRRSSYTFETVITSTRGFLLNARFFSRLKEWCSGSCELYFYH